MSSSADLRWLEVVGLEPKLKTDDITTYFQTATKKLVKKLIYFGQHEAKAMIGMQGLDRFDAKKLTGQNHIILGVKLRVTEKKAPSLLQLQHAITFPSTCSSTSDTTILQGIAEWCTPENTIVLENVPKGVNIQSLQHKVKEVTELKEDDFVLEYKGTLALMMLQGHAAGNLEAIVGRLESHKLLKDARLKVSRLTPVKCVLVSNIKNEMWRKDKLKLYFGSRKRSGGSKGLDVQVTTRGQAIVTFQKPEGAERVLLRHHAVQLGEKVDIQAYHPILTLWAEKEEKTPISYKLSRAQYVHTEKRNLMQVINDRLADMKLSAKAELDSAKAEVCIEPTAGSEYNKEWNSLCNDVLRQVLDTISEASFKIPEKVAAKVYPCIIEKLANLNGSFTLSVNQDEVIITGSQEDVDHLTEAVERILQDNLETVKEIPLPVSVLVYADQCIHQALERDNPHVVFKVSLPNGKMYISGKAADCKKRLVEIEKLKLVELVLVLPVEAVRLLSMPDGRQMLLRKLAHSETGWYYFTAENGIIPTDDVTPVHSLHIIGSNIQMVQGFVDALENCIAVIDLPVPKVFQNTHHMQAGHQTKQTIQKKCIAPSTFAMENWKMQLASERSNVTVIKSFIWSDFFTVKRGQEEYICEHSKEQTRKYLIIGNAGIMPCKLPQMTVQVLPLPLSGEVINGEPVLMEQSIQPLTMNSIAVDKNMKRVVGNLKWSTDDVVVTVLAAGETCTEMVAHKASIICRQASTGFITECCTLDVRVAFCLNAFGHLHCVVDLILEKVRQSEEECLVQLVEYSLSSTLKCSPFDFPATVPETGSVPFDEHTQADYLQKSFLNEPHLIQRVGAGFQKAILSALLAIDFGQHGLRNVIVLNVSGHRDIPADVFEGHVRPADSKLTLCNFDEDCTKLSGKCKSVLFTVQGESVEFGLMQRDYAAVTLQMVNADGFRLSALRTIGIGQYGLSAQDMIIIFQSIATSSKGNDTSLNLMLIISVKELSEQFVESGTVSLTKEGVWRAVMPALIGDVFCSHTTRSCHGHVTEVAMHPTEPGPPTNAHPYHLLIVNGPDTDQTLVKLEVHDAQAGGLAVRQGPAQQCQVKVSIERAIQKGQAMWGSICNDVLHWVQSAISEASLTIPEKVAAKVFFFNSENLTHLHVIITFSENWDYILITGRQQDVDHLGEALQRIIQDNADAVKNIHLSVSVLEYADQRICNVLQGVNPHVTFKVTLLIRKMHVSVTAAGCEKYLAEIGQLQPAKGALVLAVEVVQSLSTPNGKQMLLNILAHSEAVSYYFTAENGAILTDDVTSMHTLHAVRSNMQEVQSTVDALESSTAVIDLPVPSVCSIWKKERQNEGAYLVGFVEDSLSRAQKYRPIDNLAIVPEICCFSNDEHAQTMFMGICVLKLEHNINFFIELFHGSLVDTHDEAVDYCFLQNVSRPVPQRTSTVAINTLEGVPMLEELPVLSNYSPMTGPKQLMLHLAAVTLQKVSGSDVTLLQTKPFTDQNVLVDPAVSGLELSNGAGKAGLERIGGSKHHLECVQYTQPDGNAILLQIATARGHMCCKQFSTIDENSYGCQGIVPEKDSGITSHSQVPQKWMQPTAKLESVGKDSGLSIVKCRMLRLETSTIPHFGNSNVLFSIVHREIPVDGCKSFVNPIATDENLNLCSFDFHCALYENKCKSVLFAVEGESVEAGLIQRVYVTMQLVNEDDFQLSALLNIGIGQYDRSVQSQALKLMDVFNKGNSTSLNLSLNAFVKVLLETSEQFASSRIVRPTKKGIWLAEMPALTGDVFCSHATRSCHGHVNAVAMYPTQPGPPTIAHSCPLLIVNEPITDQTLVKLEVHDAPAGELAVRQWFVEPFHVKVSIGRVMSFMAKKVSMTNVAEQKCQAMFAKKQKKRMVAELKIGKIQVQHKANQGHRSLQLTGNLVKETYMEGTADDSIGMDAAAKDVDIESVTELRQQPHSTRTEMKMRDLDKERYDFERERTEEKQYDEEIIRKTFRNFMDVFIKRLPMYTFPSTLCKRGIISDEERQLISTSDISVQGKKLVGMLVTKDSSVLLRVVKALKQDEVGYEASVQKFFADLDEMQQNQATQPAKMNYHADDVRNTFKKFRETLKERIPIATFPSNLWCEGVISEEEHTVISDTSSSAQKRMKLLDILQTKDGSALMKALDVLQTRECGYRELVEEIHAHLDEMDKARSACQKKLTAVPSNLPTAGNSTGLGYCMHTFYCLGSWLLLFVALQLLFTIMFGFK